MERHTEWNQDRERERETENVIPRYKRKNARAYRETIENGRDKRGRS